MRAGRGRLSAAPIEYLRVEDPAGGVVVLRLRRGRRGWLVSARRAGGTGFGPLVGASGECSSRDAAVAAARRALGGAG